MKTSCQVKDMKNHYNVIAEGIRIGGLYKLDVKVESHQAMVSTCVSTEELWHKRYGHLNLQDLISPQRKDMVQGLPTLKNENISCDGCALGKQHRSEFPINSNQRKRSILELVHTYVCGPMQTKSLGGASYFLIFTDDCSRYTWVYLLRNKSEVFECFKEFKVMVEKQTAHNIKILRSDQGGEYTSDNFVKYCKDNGVIKQYTVPHSPEQNGVVERKK